jgi:phosphatidylinositol alpha-mannosyltransferase
MRIAIASPYDWSVPGGVNRHILNLAEHFIRKGHEPEIIAPSSKPLTSNDHHVRVIGESVIGLPASGSVANVCLSYDLGPRVKRLLERETYDVVHVHEPFMPLLPFQFIRYARCPVVSTFHAAREGGSRVYAYTRFLIEPYWRKIDIRIAHSRAALALIGKYFADRYRIIPSGIDYAFFAAEVPPIPQFMDDKRNILFVGRQEKRKGLPYLIEAFAMVKKEMPRTRLIVVGPDGGIRDACLRYIRTNNVEDVVFTDFVDYDDLPRYYQTGDVFCAPNTGAESLGLILLEAMAAGRPIVASRIGGFKDVVTSGKEGLLVPPRDSRALADALLSLLQDDKRREQMGRAGAVRAQGYSWDEVSSRVLGCYEEAIARHPSGNGA